MHSFRANEAKICSGIQRTPATLLLLLSLFLHELLVNLLYIVIVVAASALQVPLGKVIHFLISLLILLIIKYFFFFVRILGLGRLRHLTINYYFLELGNHEVQ